MGFEPRTFCTEGDDPTIPHPKPLFISIYFSVLEGFDPSFLSQFNNLQETQIDDLENALMPHLHGSSQNNSFGQRNNEIDVDRNKSNKVQVFFSDPVISVTR